MIGIIPGGSGTQRLPRLFDECLATASACERMRAFLELGGQTREVEAARDAFAGDWLTV